MSEPKYVNLDTVSIARLSIWTVLGATPVPIFWIFVLCQFVFITLVIINSVAADVSQTSENRLADRQSTISLLCDLLTQFAKLSDEADVADSEYEVSQVSDRLSELKDRLATRRTAVEVFQIQPSLFLFSVTVH